MARRVFISYRRDDVPDVAARIRDSLAVRFGPRHVFMDVESLLPGGQFDEGLANALENSDILLVVIGPRWGELMASRAASGETDFVRMEIAGALARKMAVIPVRVGDQGNLPPLPRAAELPSDIRHFVRYQSQDLTYQSLGSGIDALIQAIVRLRRDEARKRTSAVSSVAQRTILLLSALGVGGLLVMSAGQVEIDKGLTKLAGAGSIVWLMKGIAQPDFRSLDVLLDASWRTLAIALWGVALAGIVSVPLALASSGNLSTSWIAWPFRRLTRVLEITEVAIIGALFLLLFGFGPFSAVLAICVHNTGVLSRAFSEAVELADRPIANVRYASATSGQILYAVLPEVLPQWAASTAMRLSSAVRSALVLDLIGSSGGIGQKLMQQMQMFDFALLSVSLMLVVAMLIIVDAATRLISRLLGQQ